MKISPTNNTSFQAKFKRNYVLDKLILNSDKNTLGRFNDILSKAQNIEDNVVYTFDYDSHLDKKDGKTAVITFYLKKNYENYIPETVHTTTKPYFSDIRKNQVTFANVYKNTLKDFLPKLEEMFANYKEPTEKILSSIAKKLV